jgi:hypothetical protein
MSYYPKSQIKTNLYTNGDEFVISTTQEIYKGHYYQVSNGNKYTGKTPEDGPNNLLTTQSPFPIEEIGIDGTFPEKEIVILNIPYESYPETSDSNTQYLNSNNSINRNIPTFNTPLPSTQDKQNGQFSRYFCKKTNELKYLEIDKETYNQLQSKDLKIAWDLYEPASLLWVIKGNQETVFNTNKASVFKIEQNQRWYGFSQYFKENYSKYYQSSTISNLYTAGGEFTTKNGQNYIGFYHIHNGTKPMVGKNHINEFHETLIPVVKPKPLTQTTSSVVITTTPTPPTTSGGGGSYGGGGGGGY